jgi:MOB kinase activator 1
LAKKKRKWQQLTSFGIFVLQEFGLIDKKELAPLQELIESIIVPY